LARRHQVIQIARRICGAAPASNCPPRPLRVWTCAQNSAERLHGEQLLGFAPFNHEIDRHFSERRQAASAVFLSVIGSVVTMGAFIAPTS
jgi:hypothetical protein